MSLKVKHEQRVLCFEVPQLVVVPLRERGWRRARRLRSCGNGTGAQVGQGDAVVTDEKSFFQYEDVTVTNTRFMVGAQTFAMSNITSVQTLKQDPKRFWPTVFIILGGLYALAALGSDNAGGAVVGLLFAGAGVAWWLKVKPMFHVMLRTSGGENKALSSEQREYIEKVVRALNEAIVARG